MICPSTIDQRLYERSVQELHWDGPHITDPGSGSTAVYRSLESLCGLSNFVDENVDHLIDEDPHRVIASQLGLDFLYRQGLIRNVRFSTSLLGMIDVDELNEELAAFYGSYQNALTVNDEIMYDATVDLMQIQLTLYL